MDEKIEKDVEQSSEGDTTGSGQEEPQSRFPDLDELQQQVAKRIKSNRKFLDTYLSEDIDENDGEGIDDPEEDSADEEPSEEL